MTKLGRREAAFGLGLVGIAGAWQVWGVQKPRLTFEPIKNAPDWSFATVGEMSGASGNDLLTIGLEKGPDPMPAQELGAGLYRDTQDGVRVAVFSDFFCPFCRGLVGRLRGRTAGPPLALNWHELPLLGPSSVLAAKAAEAAGIQGGYAKFYDQLITDGFRPLASWMRQVADRAGLDGQQLQRDMEGPQVAARLAESASAAATLGFFATPGIVIGRKAVLGSLDTELMEDLIGEALLIA